MTASEKPIRVLIVDDHRVVRDGLRTFLELNRGVAVAGEAAGGAEAVERVRQLEPDVVLMDLVMPGMDGIEATRRIVSLGLPTRVIVLTSFTEDDKVFPAIQAGASGYLLKDVSPDELVEAIRAACRGEARLHPDVTRKLMEQVVRTPAAPAPSGGPPETVESLTAREVEVIRLVAEGCSNADIARKLTISEKTVKTHVSNILGKLQLQDRTQLAVYAIRNGLADRP